MRNELETKTTKELLSIYNGLGDKPLKAWKGKRDVLIARIEVAQRALEYAATNNNVGILPVSPEVLDDRKTDDVQPTVTEEVSVGETVTKATGNAAPTRTIREAALAWLCHADYYENRDEKPGPENRVAKDHPKARSVGITYLDVIANIQKEFPGCDTSVACLRWYSVKVRAEEFGYEGYRLCQRRPRAKPTRVS